MLTRKHYEWVGGGTLFFNSGTSYPCDSEYHSFFTDRSIVCRTTSSRHLKMPLGISGPAELKKLKGVRKDSVRYVYGD